MASGALQAVLTQFACDGRGGLFHWLPLTDDVQQRLEQVFRKAPPTVFLRAADALHLACAAEHGFKTIYSHDRHLLAAAPLFGLRGVNIIACPSCARQGFDVIRTVEALEARLAHISEPISLSIIGCVVNGPGEAMFTDLGFTGGGKGSGKMYVSGTPDHNVTNEEMVEHIAGLVEARAEQMRAAKDAAE